MEWDKTGQAAWLGRMGWGMGRNRFPPSSLPADRKSLGLPAPAISPSALIADDQTDPKSHRNPQAPHRPQLLNRRKCLA